VIKTKFAYPDHMADDGGNMKVEEISRIIISENYFFKTV
jgi:hypothetical protein